MFLFKTLRAQVLACAISMVAVLSAHAETSVSMADEIVLKNGSRLIGSVTGSTRLLSADVVASDDTGTARFLIQCDDVGRGLLSIETVSGESTSFALPPCVLAPTPTEPVEESPDE